MKNTIPTPQEIKDRAKIAGLEIPALCKAAGIAPSTFYRWINGNTDPIAPYRQVVATLEKFESQ